MIPVERSMSAALDGSCLTSVRGPEEGQSVMRFMCLAAGFRLRPKKRWLEKCHLPISDI